MLSLSQEDKELLNLLNRRPDLKKRVKSILSIASDEGEGIVKADEAEERITEEVRRMGNEALTGWAESRVYERRLRERIEEYPDVPGRDYVIAETDGSMVPIVVTDKNAEDSRKGKKYLWKEARLSIAHVPGDTTLRFGAEFQEGIDEAGKNLFGCACRAGFGTGTYLHSVGDGAPWIYGQAEKQFGLQGHYLVDFYHVCEYLEAAAPVCSGKGEKASWLSRRKEFLKDGCPEKVTESLRPHLESEETEDRNAPVRRCLRYLNNRPGQFDYPEARDRGLPVGSGETESAHRYVIQKRLKIAGAWWTPKNARFMLSLRVDRADGYRERHRDNMGRAV